MADGGRVGPEGRREGSRAGGLRPGPGGRVQNPGLGRDVRGASAMPGPGPAAAGGPGHVHPEGARTRRRLQSEGVHVRRQTVAEVRAVRGACRQLRSAVTRTVLHVLRRYVHGQINYEFESGF